MGVVRSWLENRSTMTGELSLASFEMRELEEQDVGSSQWEAEDASDEIEGGGNGCVCVFLRVKERAMLVLDLIHGVGSLGE